MIPFIRFLIPGSPQNLEMVYERLVGITQKDIKEAFQD